MKSFNFIDFVIKVDEEIEVFLVEFESSNLGKSYHIHDGKVRFGRCMKCCAKTNYAS